MPKQGGIGTETEEPVDRAHELRVRSHKIAQARFGDRQSMQDRISDLLRIAADIMAYAGAADQLRGAS